MTRPNSLAVETSADETPRPLSSWYAEGASDGVGDRLLMFDNSGTPSLELLRFRRDLAAAPGFEDALRARVNRLQRFTHPAFPQARAVERLEGGGDLTLVSTYTAGKRLSDIFRSSRARAGVHPAFAAWLIRDLADALADLQRQGPGVVHGALTADRIVLTGDGRLMITEHAIGGAIERLRLTAARLWADFGVIAPESHDGVAALDQRSDVVQLAWIVLSVLLGRRISPAEYPYAAELLDEFARTSGRRSPALVPSLRCWLERALRSDEHGFQSASHAQDALRELGIHAAPHAIEPLPMEPIASDETPELSAAALPPLSLAESVPDIDRVVRRREPEIQTGAVRRDLFADLGDRALDRPPPVVVPTVLGGRVTLGWIAAAVFALCAVIETIVIARMATRSVVAVPAAVPLTRESPEPAAPALADGTKVGNRVLTASRAASAKTTTTSPAVDRATDAAAIAQAAARERRGGIRISSPIQVQVLEGERILGSSSGRPIVTTPGRHELDFINTAIGYRSHQTVDIKPGQIVAMAVVPPDGRISVNALPWAQVWINGNSVGETPIANLPLAVGEHQITFRHPQLGEKTQTVVVRADALTRVSATFAR